MAQPLRRKSSKREVILIKAASMFKDKGFAASSMRDLAETVGIEAASLYNHIKSKSEILQEIIFHTATECNIHLDEVDVQEKSSLKKIEEIIRFHIRMMLTRFEEYHVMTHEWMHLSEPYLTDFIGQRRSYVQRLEAIVDQGIKNNEMKQVVPYVAVLTILSAVRGLEFWHRSSKKYSPQQMEDNMVMHLITGLRA
ncbi:MAG TPA: TetR/AcrR family transcriptional regulator [Chitinophagaceae bacterium]|nr:TetR/AcrR family transcriptional regulator [Chitinophagaceae bacterium]